MLRFQKSIPNMNINRAEFLNVHCANRVTWRRPGGTQIDSGDEQPSNTNSPRIESLRWKCIDRETILMR
jgi:hypothetical protein